MRQFEVLFCRDCGPNIVKVLMVELLVMLSSREDDRIALFDLAPGPPVPAGVDEVRLSPDLYG